MVKNQDAVRMQLWGTLHKSRQLNSCMIQIVAEYRVDILYSQKLQHKYNLYIEYTTQTTETTFT